MKLLKRRLSLDFIAFGLLIGIGYVIQLFPITPNMLIGFSVPLAVGFGRGFAEHRFVGSTSCWAGTGEWVLIVIAAHITSCYLAVLSWPYQNFTTVFGFTLLIILLPSVVLSTISYWIGVFAAVRLSRKRM